jgi:hypothetical protein
MVIYRARSVKHRRSDDEITGMMKQKLADMIEGSSVAEEVVQLSNALTRVLAIGLKMNEGDWGEELPIERSPGENGDATRNPPGR